MNEWKWRGLLAPILVVALGVLASRALAPHEASTASALPAVVHQQVCVADAAGKQVLHHAGVVVVFPDGTDTYCVSFDEDELSGAELLERTGLPLVLSGFGGLGAGVCRIDDVGCSDPGDCFCQCRGADCHYWTYYELDGAEWRFLPIGASQRRVHDGDVDGWVWGNGHTAPTSSSIGGLCPTVQPTPVPTATPRPSNVGGRATETPRPPAESPTLSRVAVSGPQQPRTQVATSTRAAPTRTGDAPATATPALRVLRNSSRPTSEVNAARSPTNGDDGDGPKGLVWFGVAAAGIAVVVGGVVARNRLRGR